MGLFSIVLFKQQQMPCDDNKASSWKSGRKTKGFSWTLKVLNICRKEKNWKSGIRTFENSGTTGTRHDVLLSSILRVFIRPMIWTFILERDSFCVRFVTQLQIWKTSKAWTLMFLLRGCLSNTWFEYSFREETVSVSDFNSASNFKGFYQDI